MRTINTRDKTRNMLEFIHVGDFEFERILATSQIIVDTIKLIREYKHHKHTAIRLTELKKEAEVLEKEADALKEKIRQNKIKQAVVLLRLSDVLEIRGEDISKQANELDKQAEQSNMEWLSRKAAALSWQAFEFFKQASLIRKPAYTLGGSDLTQAFLDWKKNQAK